MPNQYLLFALRNEAVLRHPTTTKTEWEMTIGRYLFQYLGNLGKNHAEYERRKETAGVIEYRADELGGAVALLQHCNLIVRQADGLRGAGVCIGGIGCTVGGGHISQRVGCGRPRCEGPGRYVDGAGLAAQRGAGCGASVVVGST